MTALSDKFPQNEAVIESVRGQNYTVLDLNDTRIIFGNFVATGNDNNDNDNWTKVTFPKLFEKDSVISVSVSLQQRPSQLYPAIVGSVTHDSFEFLCGLEESDPIYTKFLETKRGRPLSQQDVNATGSKFMVLNTEDSLNIQADWQYALLGIKASYIAIGKKPK